MAAFVTNIPPEMQSQLDLLYNLDQIAPQMLNEAMPIVSGAVKARLEAHRQTGELIQSVKYRRAGKSRKGGWISSVYFDGYDKNSKPSKGYPRGKPNAVKAAGIEYGSSHQTADPFLNAAAKDAEDAAIEKMREVYEREALK